MASEDTNGFRRLDNAQIAALARYASEHGVIELEWQDGDARVAMKITPARRKQFTATSLRSQPQPPRMVAVSAPAFGEFHQPAGLSVCDGQVVVEGQILAYLRLGPVMKAIRATEHGVVKNRGYGEGTLVGYGDVVFEIIPHEDGSR